MGEIQYPESVILVILEVDTWDNARDKLGVVTTFFFWSPGISGKGDTK